MDKIVDERLQLVVKRNELIQKAKFNLTATQQKIIAYLISKIKPTDKELERYEVSIRDFCLLCGINKDYFYTEIKDIIDNLDSKTFWVETEEKLFKFRWFSEVDVLKGKGKIRFLINSNIKEYLIDLKQNFTQYELYNILALKGKYSIRLYEWFKSYSYQHEKEIEINTLKRILFAEHYKEYKPFKRRVIEPAIEEINHYTDLEVSYEKVIKGRTVTGLIFYIRFKDAFERFQSYQQTIDKINKKTGQIEGQRSLFDLEEDDFR